MRFALIVLPLAGLVLAGCVSGGAPSSQRISTTLITPERSADYMTPGQSETLVTMPGDSTTAVQMRYLSTPSLNDDSSPPETVLSQ
jgi:hypothetical protein